MYRNYCNRAGKAKKAPRRRKVEKIDDFLECKRGVWHAVMPGPRDVQEALAGKAVRKTRFDASLNTKDLEEAATSLPAQISVWRNRIAEARRQT